jgi:putative transposase
VIVVWGNGRNHQGPALRELQEQFPRLRVAWLPPCAPALSPVESLWSYLKYGRLANFVPEDVNRLNDVVLEHLIATKLATGLREAIWLGSELPLPIRQSRTSDH